MKEYKVIHISFDAQDTENHLNMLASHDWKVVCSYAAGNKWIILERDRPNKK